MNLRRVTSASAVLAAFSLSLFSAERASAQTATAATNPVGFLSTQCLGSSDTLVALPFTRPAAFTGGVTSISGNTITFTAPGFTANQFAPTGTSNTPPTSDTYYVSVGPKTAALTGTIAVAQNSTTVTGTGTSFNTQLVVGDRLTFSDGANTLTYLVTAIASATSLTIDRAFVDASATATSGLAASFDHSPYEGRYFFISSNTTTSVNVTLNGETGLATNVLAGTQVSIIPAWTLNTVFPAADANVSFTPSASTRAFKTKIFIPSYGAAGIDNSASASYFYISAAGNVGWRLVGDAITTDHGYDPLLPDGYFTVSQTGGAPTTTLTFLGSVPVNKLATPLATSSTASQDNPVGFSRPAGVTLNSLGLSPANGSFVATTSTRSFQDQLFLFDNSLVSFDKTASAIYFYFSAPGNTGWRLNGDAITTDHGNDVIPAAAALIVRKVKTAAGGSVVYSNPPNY